MYEIQLASFALGIVVGVIGLSALTCAGILVLAWRFSRGEEED